MIKGGGSSNGKEVERGVPPRTRKATKCQSDYEGNTKRSSKH